MIRINLLPHREARRKRQQQQFNVMLGAVLLLAGGIWFTVHGTLSGRFEEQVSRNQFLQAEIAKLDKEIEDIKKLRELTAALLSRKHVVETLQANRSEVVQLLDELPRRMPDGIYLKALKQQGRKVTIEGYTQSQARVSTLMRNLVASPYLENANLIEVKAVPQANTRVNEFTLTVNIVAPPTPDEKQMAARAAAR
jgi:type IV pilus assembly protein PilN